MLEGHHFNLKRSSVSDSECFCLSLPQNKSLNVPITFDAKRPFQPKELIFFLVLIMLIMAELNTLN